MSKFRGLRVALIPIGAVVLASTMAMKANPTRLPCEIAAEWVEAHAGSLPTTYHEFSTYQMSYRKAIYRHLAVEQRTSLWLAHLNTFLDAGSTLSAEQREFIRYAQSRFPVYLQGDEGRRALVADRFDAKADSLFGGFMATVIFRTLGPTSTPDASGASTDSLAAVDAGRALASGRSLAMDQCTCATIYGGCMFGTCGGNTGCTPTHEGCGTAWCIDCNAQCGYYS